MHKLTELLADRISTGLRRKTIDRCSVWAERYRVMGKPFPGQWTFDYHPWSRDIHDADADMVVGQKAAQMGFTECALNRTFYNIDVLGVSCLYVLPASTPDASDFSTSRFDPALESSPHLRNLFSDVKNIGHKRAGNANLYVRGSRSKSQLRSIAVSHICFDEVDVMVQENISLAMERMSGQIDKQAWLISTPTIDNFGINAYYQQSTQDHYMFKCPHCSKITELIFPECLVITAENFNDTKLKESYIICKECKDTLPHETKGEWLKTGRWVSSYTDRISRGFHINQLYSFTVAPWMIAQLYLKSLTNPTDEQEFYNSKLGVSHVVDGARVTDTDIDECIGMHRKSISPQATGFRTLGIDVGKWLHFEVDEWKFDSNTPSIDINLMAQCKVIQQGKVEHFEQLDEILIKYGIASCVIDANPEKRKALEFAQRFPGLVKMCYYGRGVKGKNITEHQEEDYSITVDRTSWLDLSLGRFHTRKILLPIDVDLEYKSNIKALVRIYERDGDGNQTGKYVCGSQKDHFAHARNYAEIALKLIGHTFGMGNATNVY